MATSPPTFSRFLTEAYKIASLKTNRMALTAEEREKVMKAGAVWHHGINGKETAAVWKTKDSQGNIIYVTNTHRAFATDKTLQGAIRKFHSTIKDTA